MSSLQTTSVEPVQRIAFLLWQGEFREEYQTSLQQAYGHILHFSQAYPFRQTSYYQPEMGEDLYRAVVGFHGLVDPTQIITDKLTALDVERQFLRCEGGRHLNVDVGYMDADKLVLPSLKRGPRKVYAGQGVWLDMQFFYAKGSFVASPWAFEDFVRNPYQRDLLRIREHYKKQLREWRNGNSHEEFGRISP